MAILVISILVFLTFVLSPLFFFLAGRSVRIKNLGFWQACRVWFLLFAFNVAVSAFYYLVFAKLVYTAGTTPVEVLIVSVVLGLLEFAVVVGVVRWQMKATVWQAVGCVLIHAVLAVGAVFGMRAVALEAFAVPTGGMSPTILSGERIMVDKLTGRFRGFQRGDIVIFPNPAEPSVMYVKRIAAKGADRLEVRNDVLYVNGVASGECSIAPYSPPGLTPLKFPCTVPEGKVLLLGDNRGNSLDGRYFGFVDESGIKGIAVIVYASVQQPLDPCEKQGQDPTTQPAPGSIRWGRIGTILR